MENSKGGRIKLLIAAPTCVEHLERQKVCEELWGSTGLCDVMFYTAEEFMVPAEADTCRTDELGYFQKAGQNLSYRLRSLCHWALLEGYNFLFKCDTDTCVWVDNLLSSGFSQYDYVGYRQDDGSSTGYASGGAGFWLSRFAMQTIATTQDASDPVDDAWVGRTMRDAGIALHHDERYRPKWCTPREDLITMHAFKDPAQMRWVHGGGRP